MKIKIIENKTLLPSMKRFLEITTIKNNLKKVIKDSEEIPILDKRTTKNKPREKPKII